MPEPLTPTQPDRNGWRDAEAGLKDPSGDALPGCRTSVFQKPGVLHRSCASAGARQQPQHKEGGEMTERPHLLPTKEGGGEQLGPGGRLWVIS